jgi:Saxitoxin biosynthesis operon protein SxtJ
MIKAFHESYSRDETVIGGSDRSFGIVMTVAFAVMSLLNWCHNGHSWRWTGGIAVLFLAAALLFPAALKPLNRQWLKFGLLLHKVVNPIVMALVFFGTVLPTGLIMRALGKDTR